MSEPPPVMTPYASPQAPIGCAPSNQPPSLWNRLGCAGALVGIAVFWLVAVVFALYGAAGLGFTGEWIGPVGFGCSACAGALAIGRVFYLDTDKGDLRRTIDRTLAWTAVLAIGFPLTAFVLGCLSYWRIR